MNDFETRADGLVISRLLEYVREEYGGEAGLEIREDSPLLSSGIIDSFALVSLQAFIEREFGKRIPAALITAQSFDTVVQLARLISQFQ